MDWTGFNLIISIGYSIFMLIILTVAIRLIVKYARQYLKNKEEGSSGVGLIILTSLVWAFWLFELFFRYGPMMWRIYFK